MAQSDGIRVPLASLLAGVLLLATTGLLVAGAGVALASGGLRQVSVTKQVNGPTGGVASATARCPAGMRALSGGYGATKVFHPNGSGTALIVNTSRRLGPGAWKVSAYQVGGGDTVELTATVNCTLEPWRPKVRLRKISIVAGSGNPNPGNSSAHCPRHFFPVAGGFHISINGRSTNPSDSPPVSTVFGSRAVARSWAVTGARIGPGSSSLETFAYCYPVRPLGRPKSTVMRLRFPIGNGHMRTPRCPRHWYAASGGYSARFPMGQGTATGLPISSTLLGSRRWKFAVIVLKGDSSSFDGFTTFNGFTYCLRRSG